jgi:N-methylhydantoinase B
MGYKLMRMSYSSIIRESEDFGAAICDATGRQLCECSKSTPLQSGPIPGYVRGIIREFEARGDVFRPGDVIIHNDPYNGASHAPDIGFCVPIFHEDRLIGFSMTTAHHLDIGSSQPGSVGVVICADSYAEGLRFRALKVYDQGRRNEPLWRMITDNVRVSDLVVGDMDAQIAACHVGARRLLDLVERYGHETLTNAIEDLFDYSERLMRSQIAKLKDGTYSAVGYLDGFLGSDDPAVRNLPIKVTVTVSGSDLTIDLTGTAPQVAGHAINMPFVGTVDVALWLTLRSILLDSDIYGNIPQNDGLYRPVKIIAPRGCIANPVFPGADDRAVRAGQRRRGHADARARSRPCPSRSRPASRISRPSRSAALRASSSGCTSRSSRQLRRPAAEGRSRQRRHAVRKHAQQSDRGHRKPRAAARHALRAARGRRSARGAGAAGSTRSRKWRS